MKPLAHTRPRFGGVFAVDAAAGGLQEQEKARMVTVITLKKTVWLQT